MEKKEPSYTVGENAKWCSYCVKQYGGSSIKLKIELSYDPVIPPLAIYPKKMKTLDWKDTCTPMCIAAWFSIAQIWKQPRCPLIGEWIKKTWYVLYSGLLFIPKKEWNLAICNDMDEARKYNAKWNKSVRERHIPYDFILCGIWETKQMNKGTKRETNQETDI